MRTRTVTVHRSDAGLRREDELAWQVAEVALDPQWLAAGPGDDVTAVVVDRVLDDAAVATAALLRAPVAAARAQALAHPPSTGGAGARVVGTDRCASVEWAAWAGSVAVRELDFHDTFLAAEYSHPGDNVPPLLAVAQHLGLDGAALLRGIVTGYEVQVDLARGICLHAHGVDHVAHLGVSVAAGLVAMLAAAGRPVPVEVAHAAVGQALHTTTATRQSRKGAISTWKAYAPAFAGKAAVEAVDRALRGQTSPAPVYEGEDGVLARLLDGPGARYEVPLPDPGEPRRAILDTYTKEHSAEYQAQAVVDLARRLHHEHPRLRDPAQVASIVLHTSHHTHVVIGSGSGDPQKYDPRASRETLDHSAPYVLAVALQDGRWHHDDSYAPERAARPDTVALWRKVSTVEDAGWTRRYHDPDPTRRAFGGRVVATLVDGSVVEAELAVADAHPAGARPFTRPDQLAKLAVLADGVLDDAEVARFSGLAQRLPDLDAAEVRELGVVARPGLLATAAVPAGLF